MSTSSPTPAARSWFGRMLAMPNDSVQKTLFVSITLCLICSILVATPTVLLKPVQAVNKTLDIKRNILEVGGLLTPGKSVEEAFKQVETRIVELDTGEYTDAVDPATYDPVAAVKNPNLSAPVPVDEDIAKIKRRVRYAPVYLIRDDAGRLKTLILPVHGYGLWSTMYGFLALEPDLNTIKGLKFYQHLETPGLGGEVDNPQWRALWPGKQVYDDQGRIRIELIKGAVDPGKPDARFEVDGLAGSTLTSRGVTHLLHYWLGENGFGPYLQRLDQEKRG